MFQTNRPRSTIGLILNQAELVFHATVRKVREAHGNALMSILLSLAQSLLFLAAFYLMFSILGQRSISVRGDFMLYLVTGIFAYLTHIQAVRRVAVAESSTSAMMQHAPMNTLVAILSAALASLYVQTLSLGVILLVLHTVFTPLEFAYWPGAFMMFILAWATGCAVGLLLMAMKPWMPDATNIIMLVYIRANMLASGKMFVANMLPGSIIVFFSWNPLFHVIDQARGFTFVNYFPRYTNWEYAVYVTIALTMIGLMAEFYTRKHASASWEAKR